MKDQFKIIVFVLSFGLCYCNVKDTKTKVDIVENLDNSLSNSNYVNNRKPLQSLYLYKLPVGSIKPASWLGKMLELQSNGLAGNLSEISVWLRKDSSAWLSKDGLGKYGWEEMPYWLKGYGNIGYVLGNKKMIDEAKVWLDAAMDSQRPTGDFGPIVYRNGKRDLWANMLMLFSLQSYYEYSNDKRVLQLMGNYFKWQQTVPDSLFLKDYWENSRGGDNLYSVYWLYNINGDTSLLSLAEKIHRNTANWRQDTTLPNWHNVNIAQCFREPATYFLQSHNERDRNATYKNFDLIREKYGQVPGGMFGSDENSRVGYTDPRQCVETCGMLEQMASDEMLLRFTGDKKWAENCEDVAFNTFPAAFMPDQKSLRYLTAPNMVVSDSKDHSPGIDNGGPYLMMNPFSSRCCQHNHTSGWVYYAEHLMMATPDDGVAAMFYSSSESKIKVGKGDSVVISETTNYPFEDEIAFEVKTDKPVDFPFYFRIPSWADSATVMVNGEPMPTSNSKGKYIKITKTWKQGDKVSLKLPMKISVRTWVSNKGFASVNYGPLTYSLKINEEYRQMDGQQTAQWDAKWRENVDHTKWPSFEIFPASPWNYGLFLTGYDIPANFSITKKAWPADNNPFTLASVPIEMKTKGKKIPTWTIDKYGLCAVLPESPVASNEKVEEITLIPMGAAKLRISAFPVISNK